MNLKQQHNNILKSTDKICGVDPASLRSLGLPQIPEQETSQAGSPTNRYAQRKLMPVGNYRFVTRSEVHGASATHSVDAAQASSVLAQESHRVNVTVSQQDSKDNPYLVIKNVLAGYTPEHLDLLLESCSPKQRVVLLRALLTK